MEILFEIMESDERLLLIGFVFRLCRLTFVGSSGSSIVLVGLEFSLAQIAVVALVNERL